MRIASTISDSIVDGPGLRFTVFTQGCPHGCPGCHNPDTHDPNGGSEVSLEDLAAKMLKNPLTDGLTLSGGDPFTQAADCAALAQMAKKAGLNIWAYTGYTYENLV
ncbi:MAG: 4Fe-4S single cluster domain-containing protein, partial [Oscillospiraceae bacterium]